MAGLTALLYTPIFLKSGIGAVVNNSYVRPDDPATLAEQIGARVASTAEQWTAGTPWGVGMLSVFGFTASLALHKRISRTEGAAASGGRAVNPGCHHPAKSRPAGKSMDVPAAAVYHLVCRRHPGAVAVGDTSSIQPQSGMGCPFSCSVDSRRYAGLHAGRRAAALPAHMPPGQRKALHCTSRTTYNLEISLVTQSPIATPLQYYFQAVPPAARILRLPRLPIPKKLVGGGEQALRPDGWKAC